MKTAGGWTNDPSPPPRGSARLADYAFRVATGQPLRPDSEVRAAAARKGRSAPGRKTHSANLVHLALACACAESHARRAWSERSRYRDQLAHLFRDQRDHGQEPRYQLGSGGGTDDAGSEGYLNYRELSRRACLNEDVYGLEVGSLVRQAGADDWLASILCASPSGWAGRPAGRTLGAVSNGSISYCLQVLLGMPRTASRHVGWRGRSSYVAQLWRADPHAWFPEERVADLRQWVLHGEVTPWLRSRLDSIRLPTGLSIQRQGTRSIAWLHRATSYQGGKNHTRMVVERIGQAFRFHRVDEAAVAMSSQGEIVVRSLAGRELFRVPSLPQPDSGIAWRPMSAPTIWTAGDPPAPAPPAADPWAMARLRAIERLARKDGDHEAAVRDVYAYLTNNPEIDL